MEMPCPHCSQLLDFPPGMTGEVECPYCGGRMVTGEQAPPPLPEVLPMMHQTYSPRTPRVQYTDPGQQVVAVAVGCSLLGAGFGVPLGAFASQFAPVFGGIAVTFGEPFSPARLTLVPGHCMLFGFLGALLFGAGGAVFSYLNPGRDVPWVPTIIAGVCGIAFGVFGMIVFYSGTH